MKRTQLWPRLAILLALLFLVACNGTTTDEPAESITPDSEDTAEPTDAPDTGDDTGGFQIPDIEEGKFNVAMVLIGPHDDGGWSEAHYDGLLYVQENMADSHVAYIEL